MPSLLEEMGGVVDEVPEMFAGKVRCSVHKDELAIGMTWKHGDDEFHCTACYVYENTACTKSTKSLLEWTSNFAGEISRLRSRVGLPELSANELQEIVSRTHRRVVSAQTGYGFHDRRLWSLQLMQSQLEAISAALQGLEAQGEVG